MVKPFFVLYTVNYLLVFSQCNVEIFLVRTPEIKAMARKSRSKAKAAVTISNENGSNKQQSSVKREREGSDLKIAKNQGEKPTVKKKKSTGIPVRRSSRRKCNVSITVLLESS